MLGPRFPKQVEKGDKNGAPGTVRGVTGNFERKNEGSYDS